MKRNVYLLCIIAFIVNLGFGTIMPLLPFLLLYYEGELTDLPENLGTIPNVGELAIQITILTSIFMLTRAFLARYFGNLSDHIGRKRIIFTGLLLYTILSYGYILSRSWIDILIVRGIQGVASAMVWPVSEAMLTDSVHWSERGKYMGYYMTTSNVSFFAGPLFGAYLYKFAAHVLGMNVFDALTFPFYVMTANALVGMIISIFTVETTTSFKSANWKFSIITLILGENKETIKIPKHISKSIKVLYVMGFANGVAMGLVAPISMVFVIHYITSDPAATGMLATLSSIVGFLANYPAGIISDKIGRKKVVIVGQLGTRVATLLLPFSKTYEELLAIYSLRAAAFNIVSPAYRALQADLVPKKLRGKVFGTVQSLFNFGAAFAPIGGAIYQIAMEWEFNILGYMIPGIAISFWISAFIGLISLILFITLVYEPEKQEKEKLSI